MISFVNDNININNSSIIANNIVNMNDLIADNKTNRNHFKVAMIKEVMSPQLHEECVTTRVHICMYIYI